MHWKSNIHSVVFISCHKDTSRIYQYFSWRQPYWARGRFSTNIYTARFLKTNSLFKHIGKFHKQCRSHTLCIPKYEQYQVRTYCQNVSMVEVPTIFARVLKPTMRKYPPPSWGKKNNTFWFFTYHGKSDFVALYVEHANSDKVALCLGRSPGRSLKKLR